MDEFKKVGLMDGAGEWDESKHPRDEEGKFASVERLAKTLNQVVEKKLEKQSQAMQKFNQYTEKKRVETAFREQLNQVQNGAFDKNSHLQLGITPNILVEKAKIPRLPLMMPYSKAYLAINKSGEIEGNYHDLGVGTLSNLPTALHSPIYIFEHKDPKRIEVVVELKDKKGKNIMTSIEFNTVGLLDSTRIPANVLITAFAPKNNNYINSRKENGRIIYEKKS